MHECADEQSTALRYVSAPATFGVGAAVHAADAAEGASNNAVVAIRTRRTDLSDIYPLTLRVRSVQVKRHQRPLGRST